MMRDALQIRESLVDHFMEQYPDEAVSGVEALPLHDMVAVVERRPPAQAADFVRRMRPDLAADLLQQLSEDSFSQIAPAFDPARLAQLMARFERDKRDRLLSLLEERLANELHELMTYPPESAGALMDAVVTTLRPESTVHDALERLRKSRDKALFHVFVIDRDGQLVGAIPLQELALASPGDRLATLMRGTPHFIEGMAPESEVVEILERDKLPSLPVVDIDHRLIGVIRHDGLVRATEKEALADVQKMVGASKSERALSPVSFAVRKRLPWLQINLGTAFLAAFVVGLFEDTIAQFTALAVLLPVAAGQSGNTGAQALAVTMRGLALREIRVRHWLRVTSKELATGFVNGVAVAVVTAGAVFLWSRSAGLALVIGVAMVVSMAIAGVAGTSVPIMLTILRQDPAQASSIILTTVTDIVGFLSFLGLATLASGLL